MPATRITLTSHTSSPRIGSPSSHGRLILHQHPHVSLWLLQRQSPTQQLCTYLLPIINLISFCSLSLFFNDLYRRMRFISTSLSSPGSSAAPANPPTIVSIPSTARLAMPLSNSYSSPISPWADLHLKIINPSEKCSCVKHSIK